MILPEVVRITGIALGWIGSKRPKRLSKDDVPEMDTEIGAASRKSAGPINPTASATAHGANSQIDFWKIDPLLWVL